MFRIYLPLVLITLFIGWVLYRLLIKRDLKQQLNTVYLGVFFIAVWGVIYTFIFQN